MPRYVGLLKCRGGWGVAEVDVRQGQRDITVRLSKTRPRARRLASPHARRPVRPEDVYAALQGGVRPLDPRRSLLGRKERWKLVQVAFPGLPVPKPPRGMSEADVLDLLILAWAASRRPSLLRLA